MINKKLNLIETFTHEEGHGIENEDEITREYPGNCVRDGKFTYTGVVMCEDKLCSNKNCCSHVSLPRTFPFFGSMKCITFEEAQKIRGSPPKK